MNAIVRGSIEAFLQDTVFDFDPTRGRIQRSNYKGASQAQMEALYNDRVLNGIACRLTFHQGDAASLEVEDSTQVYTLDVWEIVGNELNIDALSHPTVVANATSTQIAKIKGFLEENTDPVVAFADPAISALSGGVIQRFYSLIQRGATDYRRGQYVLRHTTNVPNRYNVNIADIGVDTIYTTAQLLSEAQDSSLWIYPLPGRLVYKISNIPGIPNPDPLHFRFGWLKSASTETTAANNRVNIVTEYTLELWSSDFYGVR